MMADYILEGILFYRLFVCLVCRQEIFDLKDKHVWWWGHTWRGMAWHVMGTKAGRFAEGAGGKSRKGWW